MVPLSRLRTLIFLIYISDFLCIIASGQENGMCSKDTCPGSFNYPSDLEWDSASLNEVNGWLKSQMKKETITFCKDAYSEEVIKNAKSNT